MKTQKSIDEISGTDTHPVDMARLHFFEIFSLPVWLVVISISLVSQSVRAGTEDSQLYYRYVPYQVPGSVTGQNPKPSSGANEAEAKKAEPIEQAKKTDENTGASQPSAQQSSTERKISPVKRPEKDTGEFPSGDIPAFAQVDVNGDHYVTKDELQNFPDLLRVFDKVDAGKDGRLEQHEFQNLEMETKREGEVL